MEYYAAFLDMANYMQLT